MKNTLAETLERTVVSLQNALMNSRKEIEALEIQVLEKDHKLIEKSTNLAKLEARIKCLEDKHFEELEQLHLELDSVSSKYKDEVGRSKNMREQLEKLETKLEIKDREILELYKEIEFLVKHKEELETKLGTFVESSEELMNESSDDADSETCEHQTWNDECFIQTDDDLETFVYNNSDDEELAGHENLANELYHTTVTEHTTQIKAHKQRIYELEFHVKSLQNPRKRTVSSHTKSLRLKAMGRSVSNYVHTEIADTHPLRLLTQYKVPIRVLIPDGISYGFTYNGNTIPVD